MSDAVLYVLITSGCFYRWEPEQRKRLADFLSSQDFTHRGFWITNARLAQAEIKCKSVPVIRALIDARLVTQPDNTEHRAHYVVPERSLYDAKKYFKQWQERERKTQARKEKARLAKITVNQEGDLGD